MNWGMQMYAAGGLGLIVGGIVLTIGTLLDRYRARRWDKENERDGA
jgi:hypothetical protein